MPDTTINNCIGSTRAERRPIAQSHYRTPPKALATCARTLQRRCEAMLGKSPLAYFRDLRVERARSLLHGSGLDVGAIAAEQHSYFGAGNSLPFASTVKLEPKNSDWPRDVRLKTHDGQKPDIAPYPKRARKRIFVYGKSGTGRALCWLPA